MNKKLLRLYEIAQQPKRTIIGLMSGTSLDGLDIALCSFKWKKPSLKAFKTIPYQEEVRSRIEAIRSKPTVDLQEVCVLNAELARWYASAVLEAIEEWGVTPQEVDLISSHGQTIYHLPSPTINSTLQIVDADHIASITGITTISDFRQKHIAKGGEGAPLAGIMDEAIFRDADQNRVLLNLGGIANLTWLPSEKTSSEVLTTDTGPANTLINEAMLKYFNLPFDEKGKVGRQGSVHSELLKYLLLEPYFRKPFPKTTGQEDFNLSLVEQLMESYSIEVEAETLIATLTEFTVQSIHRALDEIVGTQKFELFVSGGGVHNQYMMQRLQDRLENATIKPFDELGFSADAKEAVLMAYLANELVTGGDWELGKISL